MILRSSAASVSALLSLAASFALVASACSSSKTTIDSTSAGAGGSGGRSQGAGGQAPPGTFCSLPTPAPAGITVPPGFCVRSYSGDSATKVVIKEPRVVRIAPGGDVLVTSPGASTPGGNASGTGSGAILVLPDDDHDGMADAAITYAGGTAKSSGKQCAVADATPTDLTCVHGLAILDGYLYFSRYNELRRYPYKPGDRAPSVEDGGELVSELGMDSSSSWRFTHTIDKGTDGTIWVSRGQFESSCSDSLGLHRGAILSIDPSAPPATPKVVADGFRNPMYLRCDGRSQCFTNELTGDGWDAGGREKLLLLTQGSAWGYPCCYTKDLPAPGGDASMCAAVVKENAEFQLHSTPFGLDFEQGKWPSPYTNDVFVAMHGAVGSWVGTKIVAISTDQNGMPGGAATDFATGWGHDTAGVVGRATDLTFAPDGRMFVVDDNSGAIWWIAPNDLPLPAGW